MVCAECKPYERAHTFVRCVLWYFCSICQWIYRRWTHSPRKKWRHQRPKATWIFTRCVTQCYDVIGAQYGTHEFLYYAHTVLPFSFSSCVPSLTVVVSCYGPAQTVSITESRECRIQEQTVRSSTGIVHQRDHSGSAQPRVRHRMSLCVDVYGDIRFGRRESRAFLYVRVC